MSEAQRPPPSLIFLNALAFGSVAPLLYYVIVLPDSIWIGLLFAIDAVGRITGAFVQKRLQSEIGVKRTLIVAQLLLVTSYALLLTTGLTLITQTAGLVAVYLWRFTSALACATFPSVQLLSNAGPRASRATVITMLGFAAGCALAVPGNNHYVAISIFQTGGLARSALYATAVSLITVAIALRWQPGNDDELDSNAPRGFAPGSIVTGVIALLGEAAFGMTVCVLPLMARETYFFTPAQIAVLLGYTALLSESVRSFMNKRLTAQPGLAPFAMNAGIFMATLGFFGFVASLWLSWVSHPVDGMKLGFWLVWISGIPAAIGHGSLRATLLAQPSNHSRAAKLFDPISTMVAGISALCGAAMWLAHERSSFAVPCLLTGIALTLGISKLLFTHPPGWRLQSPPHPHPANNPT